MAWDFFNKDIKVGKNQTYFNVKNKQSAMDWLVSNVSNKTPAIKELPSTSIKDVVKPTNKIMDYNYNVIDARNDKSISNLKPLSIENKQYGLDLTDPIKPTINKKNVISADDRNKLIEQYNNAEFKRAGLGLASSVIDYMDTRQGRQRRDFLNRDLDTQKRIIDINIRNNEALSMQRFNRDVASLRAAAAANNVDINSQAITANIEHSGIALNKDFEMARIQAGLEKTALDYKKLKNNIEQRNAEAQALNKVFGSLYGIGTTQKGLSYIGNTFGVSTQGLDIL